MTTYFRRDLESNVDGDLVVGASGDLSVAEAADSYLQALKIAISTDRGEYQPVGSFGADLGTLVGSTDLERVLERIPLLVKEAIAEQRLIVPGEVSVRAFPIAVDQVLVYVLVTGRFLKPDGSVETTPVFTLKWLFPFKETRITALEN